MIISNDIKLSGLSEVRINWVCINVFLLNIYIFIFITKINVYTYWHIIR